MSYLGVANLELGEHLQTASGHNDAAHFDERRDASWIERTNWFSRGLRSHKHL